MMNKVFAVVVFAGLVGSGCYTTKVYSSRPSPQPQLDDRQWFTVAGLVPLSGPAGAECVGGLSTVESQMAFTDVLINVGLSIGGGLIGASACNSDDSAAQVRCISSFATLAPLILSSRTVRYTCASPAMTQAVPGLLPPEAVGQQALLSRPLQLPPSPPAQQTDQSPTLP